MKLKAIALEISVKMSIKLILPLVKVAFLYSVSGVAFAKKPSSPTLQEKRDKQMYERAKGFSVTNDYVHRWKRFPTAKGKSLHGGFATIRPVKGFVNVLFFLSSWDIKSQELIGRMKKMESRYSGKNTKFFYIFTHDTFEDAENFVKEFKIKNALLGEHQINKAFHHPNIPSIYVGDRHGWLSTRFLGVDVEEIRQLDNYLSFLTST